MAVLSKKKNEFFFVDDNTAWNVCRASSDIFEDSKSTFFAQRCDPEGQVTDPEWVELPVYFDDDEDGWEWVDESEDDF